MSHQKSFRIHSDAGKVVFDDGKQHAEKYTGQMAS